MTPLRRAALAAVAGVLLAAPAAAVPAVAAPRIATHGIASALPPVQRAFLFLVDRASFEEMLGVPEFASLSRAGGAGLTTFRPPPGDEGLGAYLTIGAGARAAVPLTRLAAGAGAITDAERSAIDEANDEAVPGLLADRVTASGRQVSLVGNADDRWGPNDPGVLVAMGGRGEVGRAEVAGLTVTRPTLLGAYRTDPDALAAEVAAMPPGLVVVDLGDTLRIDEEAPYAARGLAATERRPALAADGALVRRIVAASGDGEVLVVVATPLPSTDMRETSDVVTTAIVARGAPASLFPSSGPLHGLTSTSTRHHGLVAMDDLAPTILDALGIPSPVEMTGVPVRVEGPAPFAEHVRHLEHRRIRIPIQVGIAALALSILGGGLMVVRARRRIPAWVRSTLALGVLGVVAIPAALLLAGLLPHLTFAAVVSTVLAVMGVLAFLAWRRRGVDPGYPVVLIAMISAAIVVIDGVFGWRAMATSLSGVTVFEGRSYGIRNFYVGPLLAGVVLVGSRLTPRQAFLLVLAAAAFVGMPGLGSEVGGCATLLLAAPLLSFRMSGRRIRVREGLLALLTVVAGLAVIFAVDGLANPTPTHAGRLARRVAVTGPASLLHVIGDRLAATVHTIAMVPPAWLLVGAFALAAWAVTRARGPIGVALDDIPGYRSAMWVLAVSGLVAIVANDTGIATTQGLAPFLLGGLLLPALLRRDPEPARPPAPEARPLVGSRR